MAQLPLINAQTGTTYTTVLADAGKLITLNNASPITLTVPPSASVGYANGTSIDILQTGAGQVTVVGGSGVTVNASPSLKLRTQNSAATLIEIATDTWQLVGDLESAAPAFSAYQSTAQTGITTAWTKISLQTELFDTNNNFDSTTNYRFTPTVAGYYLFTGNIYFAVSGINNYISIYKNGSAIVYGTAYPTASGASFPYSSVSTLAYMNGSTDYVELWGYATNTWDTGTGIPSTYLQGFLARAA
jgi:hypothetical protein